MNKSPTIVQCSNLVASDFTKENGMTVIVKTAKASNFRVEKHKPGALTVLTGGVYIVYGRTEFVGGSITVKGIEAVRQLLATR